MTRKYKAYVKYVFDGCAYWYATNLHFKMLDTSVDFGLSFYTYSHAQFHMLMEGV